MTRSHSRIRATVVLALALAAVAAPAALADTRDAAAPVFWATPDAVPSAEATTTPARTPTRPVATSGDHGWVDAAIIVVLTLFAAATVADVRLRRRSLPWAQ